jgi:hypothetical protein
MFELQQIQRMFGMAATAAVLAVSFAFFGATAGQNPSIEAKPSENGVLTPGLLSADEAAVYSTVFANLFEAGPGRPIVLENRTSIGVPPGMWATTSVQGADTSKFLAKLSPDTRADYQAKNKKSMALPQHCELAPVCSAEDVVSLTAIVVTKNKNDKGWKNFFSKYPNSPGILLVSRIGFNSDKTEAIVYAGKSCGTLCGEGYYVRLTKIGEHWAVADQTTVWIA